MSNATNDTPNNLSNAPPIFTVGEISARVKRAVEDQFGAVRIRGELGKVSVNSASGHCYLSLKDDKHLLEAVCWKGTYQKLSIKPEMGMEVIATGKLTTYGGSSKYQMVIEAIEPAGVGALMALLEQRKKVLAAEGLFASDRKRALPALPRVIGVITSPTGAVIRDILHRIADRMGCHVLLWPTPVQGEGAAAKIAAAIAGFNALKSGGEVPIPDILIVARGGGSIEDLWPFNEEIVVRAAAASRIPLISAVGHETDMTLIDYAADRRAPTPTAAAEMAVPVKAELLAQITQLAARADAAIVRSLIQQRTRVETLALALPKPQALLEAATQRLDMAAERLSLSLPRLIAMKQQHWLRIAGALKPKLLRPLLQQHQHSVMVASERLKDRFARALERKQQQVELLARMLESLDSKAVLARGFALVRSADGSLITRAEHATHQMQIEWGDGLVVVKRD